MFHFSKFKLKITDVEVSIVSCAAIGEIFISILGVILIVRGARFYGSVREFFNKSHRLGGISCCYFISAFLVLNARWIVCFEEWVARSRIAGILFFSNVCLFYITIIHRAYISFKNDNEYKLTHLELIWSSVLVLSQFGVSLVLCIYSESSRLAVGIFYIIVLCIDIVLNITILYVFLKRLHRKIRDLDKSLDNYKDKNYNVSGNKDNPLQSDLICNNDVEMRYNMGKIRMQATEVVDIMAKISLLTIVSEIFINICFIMSVYLYIHEANEHSTWKEGHEYAYVIMEEFILITGVCINCFTLYAAFVFNDDHYRKCCSCCHKSLKKCCVMCVTGQVCRYRR